MTVRRDDRSIPTDVAHSDALHRLPGATSPREFGSGPGAVPLPEREGVFAHSFKCLVCKLEFVIYSWRRNRHRSGSIWCPECGEKTPMRHRRACLNESRAYTRTSREIHHLTTFADSVLVDDEDEGASGGGRPVPDHHSPGGESP